MFRGTLPGVHVEMQLKWLVWHGLDGVLAGLTLGCVLAWLRDRRRTGRPAFR